MSDELDELLGIDTNDPTQQLALELVEADDRLLRTLVALRRGKELTQHDIGSRMGVTQPAVAAFERVDADPKLSTIRRYALAVGAMVKHVVVDRGTTDLPDGISNATTPATGAASGKVIVTFDHSSEYLSVAK